MPHKLVWEAKGVYWKYSGKITGAEVVEASSKIYGDPRFDSLRYKLVDFLDVESIDMDDNDVAKIACMHKAAGLSNPRIKNAIVINSKTNKVANKFATFFHDSPWDVQVFEELDQANSWIDRKNSSNKKTK